MNLISDILYWISTGLLVPVVLLLIIFFVRAIVMLGGFFGRWLEVKKLSETIYPQVESLKPSMAGSFAGKLTENRGSLFVCYLRKILESDGSEQQLRLLLDNFELEAGKQIATSKILTKMGPVLGLMGTLIPMGPALVGLASGDIASMAYNMQVAFATTVVGLVVSAIGFVTQHFRESWALRQLSLLEYVAGIVETNGKNRV